MQQKLYVYNGQTRTQNYLMPEYHRNTTTTTINFADNNISKQIQKDISYSFEELDGLGNLEPIYKVANLNGKLAIIKQTIVKVTKVTKITKMAYGTSINVNQNKPEPVPSQNIDLERAKALKPNLYKLLKTLKNPESIKKIQQALASFDKMELEAAATKLKKSFGQQAKSTFIFKENLDIMTNFLKGQQSKLNEEANLLFFDHAKSLNKMIEEAKSQINC